MKDKVQKKDDARAVPYLVVGLAGALAVILIAVVMWGGAGGPEEAKVRKMVAEMAAAAEERDIKGVLKHISDDYTDNHGNDLKALKRVLLAQFFRGEDVSVFVRTVEVALRGDRGLLDVKAVLVLNRSAGKSGAEGIGDVVPEDAAGFRFDSVIDKEGGRWKVRSVKWERVGVVGLL